MTGPTSIREDFLTSADAVLVLLDRPELSDHWSRPAVLPGFTVGGLAAHLGRAVLQVDRYLDADPPPSTATLVGAAGYLVALTGIDDRDSALSKSVVARGEAEASGGVEVLRAEVRVAADRLRTRIDGLPVGRTVAPLDTPMTFEEYLRTRLVEMAVHVEDLALSLGVAPPPLSAQVVERVIALLVEAATLRHGSAAVLRALTRRERDAVDALRVF